MASSKERQRKLARAKLDRQMARRAARRRRTRQVQAGVGAALALLLITLGSVWLFGGFDPDPADDDVAICAWTPQQGEHRKDVGTPPTTDIPTSGTRPMIITTNAGTIEVNLDLAAAPCAAASFVHLSGRAFFDNTKCHELTAQGALRCGDPSGTGQGGPGYALLSEDVPDAAEPTPSPGAKATYPRGTVALVGDTPGTNGSQFLIFHKDFTTAQPDYAVIGEVAAGLEILDKIVKAGTVASGAGQQVKPKDDVVIQSLTVGEVNGAVEPDGTPSPSPAPAASPAPGASATPTPSRS